MTHPDQAALSRLRDLIELCEDRLGEQARRGLIDHRRTEIIADASGALAVAGEAFLFFLGLKMDLGKEESAFYDELLNLPEIVGGLNEERTRVFACMEIALFANIPGQPSRRQLKRVSALLATLNQLRDKIADRTFELLQLIVNETDDTSNFCLEPVADHLSKLGLGRTPAIEETGYEAVV